MYFCFISNVYKLYIIYLSGHTFLKFENFTHKIPATQKKFKNPFFIFLTFLIFSEGAFLRQPCKRIPQIILDAISRMTPSVRNNHSSGIQGLRMRQREKFSNDPRVLEGATAQGFKKNALCRIRYSRVMSSYFLAFSLWLYYYLYVSVYYKINCCEFICDILIDGEH